MTHSTHSTDGGYTPAQLLPYSPQRSPEVFRAIVWKDLRELRNWAGAMLLLAAAVMALTLWMARHFSVPMTVSYFAYETAVLAPLIGLVIGLAQFLPENRGDAWSFLVHRPATRSSIFIARGAAGLAAYLVAIGVPSIAVIVWGGLPGQLIGPFDIRMAVPIGVDLLAGMSWYFAGVLTAMRARRWYGTRALGIGAALVVSGLVYATAHLAAAAAAGVAGAFVIGVAAWGSFVTGGNYDDQPRVGRIATAVTIGAGVWVITGVTVGMVGLVLMLSEGFEASSRVSYTEYAISPEGELLVVTRGFPGAPLIGGDGSGLGSAIASVTDVAGNAVSRYDDPRAADSLAAGIGVDRIPISLAARLQPGRRGYRDGDRIAENLAELPGEQRVWYYLYGEGLFVVYDLRSALRIDWMGPNGYVAGDEPPAVRFAGAPRPIGSGSWSGGDVLTVEGRAHAFSGVMNDVGSSLLVFPHDVYWFSFVERRVEHLYTAAAGDSVLDAVISPQMVPTGPGTVRARRSLLHVVATRQGIHLLAAGTPEPRTYPHAVGIADIGMIEVLRPLEASGNPLWVRYVPERPRAAEEIVRFDSAANVAFRHSRGPTPPSYVPSWRGTVLRPLVTPVVERLGSAVIRSGRSVPAVSVPGRQREERIGWLLTLAVSSLSAAVAYARGRAYSFSRRRRWLWTAIAFGAGPLGLLLMFGLLEWPAREPCPSCGTTRAVTNDSCERCGALWPPPALNGTEIFEPALQRA